MIKKISILTLAIAVLSSCGVLRNYDREKVVDVNTDGIYGDAQSGDSLGLGDIKWREVFTDPALQALIEKALAQNVEAKNADLKLQQVEHALKATKLAFLPSIYFNPSGNISKMYDPYQRSAYEMMTSDNSKSYGLAASLGWQNTNFLQLRNQKKGAGVSREMMRNAKQAVQCALVANVAKMYYTLAQLDEQYELLKTTRDNWATYLEMERKLMDAGQANIAAVSSIEATYYSISNSLITIEDNRRILETQLCSLLGETSTHINRNSLSSFQTPACLTTGLPISILSRRPDVRTAEMALAKAFYDKAMAKSAFYPSISITANGQYTNSLGNMIVNPGLMIGTAIASLTQPIFANGRNRVQYLISKTDFEIAKNKFLQTVVEAGNEVNTAMVELNSAEESKENIDKQVAALNNALDATYKLYKYSGANYLNVITAHNSLLSAKMEQISNRMGAISATIELYQALGGGAE